MTGFEPRPETVEKAVRAIADADFNASVQRGLYRGVARPRPDMSGGLGDPDERHARAVLATVLPDVVADVRAEIAAEIDAMPHRVDLARGYDSYDNGWDDALDEAERIVRGERTS